MAKLYSSTYLFHFVVDLMFSCIALSSCCWFNWRQKRAVPTLLSFRHEITEGREMRQTENGLQMTSNKKRAEGVKRRPLIALQWETLPCGLSHWWDCCCCFCLCLWSSWYSLMCVSMKEYPSGLSCPEGMTDLLRGRKRLVIVCSSESIITLLLRNSRKSHPHFEANKKSISSRELPLTLHHDNACGHHCESGVATARLHFHSLYSLLPELHFVWGRTQ